jgi:RNA polymerase sigma-70 factor (ECF subfamily)
VKVDWSKVYRETYEDLVRYLHRNVWDAERAQDLAQEVFVRALSSNPENPRAWLFTIAANLARDEARLAIRRKKHLVLLKTEAEVKQENTVRDPAEEMERTQEQAQLEKALNELQEKDRNILLLWDAGLNYDEIATQSGISIGSVGTTLNRARKKLVEVAARMENKNAAHR